LCVSRIYLKRGRPLADLPLEELRERWVVLMRAWAEHTPKREADSEREDIEAEMKVRRVEPPFDLVRDAVDALKDKSRKATAELLKDPNRLARAEQELSAQIAEFEASEGLHFGRGADAGAAPRGATT
jgi:hypothetical protein